MKLLVFLVLCIAVVSCVELENLCSSDHFSFNYVLVNAFHRSQHQITFPGLSHYLINSSVTCDRFEFVNKTKFVEALKIKNKFNRKFAEIYTNDLGAATAEELGHKRKELAIDYWIPLYDMASVEPSSCVQTFKRITYSAYSVLGTLHRLAEYNGYPINSEADYKPTDSKAIRALEVLFKELKTGADGQTFALKDLTVFDVYFERGFVQPIEFKFLTDSSVQPDTKSMITYDQFLPFNSNQQSDEGCVPVEELPLFYKKKGKPCGFPF